MFFCENCEIENDWPGSIFSSYGRCEMCGKVAACSDVPSRFLTPAKPKKVKPQLDIDSVT